MVFAYVGEDNPRDLASDYRRTHHTITFLLHQHACVTLYIGDILYDSLVTIKAAPHECLIRTGQPQT